LLHVETEVDSVLDQLFAEHRGIGEAVRYGQI